MVDQTQSSPALAASAARYGYSIDLESESTAAQVVRLVGLDKRVLELGCAAGHMTQVLQERGCRVTAVEIDAEAATQARAYADRVIVGDLDELDLVAELGPERFDVVVAADVLEHLRDPLAALATVRRRLSANGFLVASFPNVAHASVRLALWNGGFPYSATGLLDKTHLRFFTRASIEQLLADAGFLVTSINRQPRLLEGSEVPADPSTLPAAQVAALVEDPDALTYQYVVVAYPVADAVAANLPENVRIRNEGWDSAHREIARLRTQISEQAHLEQRVAEQSVALADRSGIQAALAEMTRTSTELVGRLRDVQADLAAVRRELVQQQDFAALTDQVARLSGMTRRLAAALQHDRAEAGRRETRLFDTLQSVESALGSPAQAGPTPGGAAKVEPDEYQHLVAIVREGIQQHVPADATVAIVSRGDDDLLRIVGRRARHFPQSPEGGYAGFYPADGAAAIACLESVRERGADYLVFPRTAFWWLDHYAELRTHLETRYRRLPAWDDACLAFCLREPEVPRSADAVPVADPDYARLVGQIRELVEVLLPAGATVAVVSRGDDALLSLGQRVGWHFPRTPDGIYAGTYPADSTQAIAAIEAIRAAGAGYLVIPRTAFWWLEHYPDMARYLVDRCRRVTHQAHVCAIYDLQLQALPSAPVMTAN